MDLEALRLLSPHLVRTEDTVIDMPTEQEVTVQIEDGREYPAILFGGRLDNDVLKDQLAHDGLILSKLDGKISYRNGNGLSRTKFTATVIKAQTARHPGRKSAQAYPPAKNQCQVFHSGSGSSNDRPANRLRQPTIANTLADKRATNLVVAEFFYGTGIPLHLVR
ncbi:hypothetical protein WJX77_001381 [Trebouxia sp. C0004]